MQATDCTSTENAAAENDHDAKAVCAPDFSRVLCDATVHPAPRSQPRQEAQSISNGCTGQSALGESGQQHYQQGQERWWNCSAAVISSHNNLNNTFNSNNADDFPHAFGVIVVWVARDF